MKYIITTKRKHSIAQKLDLVIDPIQKKSNKNFLEFNLVILDKGHEDYKYSNRKIDTQIDIMLQDFFIHLRPNSILKLMVLFVPTGEDEMQEDKNEKHSGINPRNISHNVSHSNLSYKSNRSIGSAL